MIGHSILLLHTKGRRSGLWRITPLQYDEIEGDFYVGSARGANADWYQNILADSQVKVRVGSRCFRATATPSQDAGTVANFLRKRYERRPMFMGILFRVQGYPLRPDMDDFKRYASGRTMVILTPS